MIVKRWQGRIKINGKGWALRVVGAVVVEAVIQLAMVALHLIHAITVVSLVTSERISPTFLISTKSHPYLQESHKGTNQAQHLSKATKLGHISHKTYPRPRNPLPNSNLLDHNSSSSIGLKGLVTFQPTRFRRCQGHGQSSDSIHGASSSRPSKESGNKGKGKG